MRNFVLAAFALVLFSSPVLAAGKPVVKIGVTAPLSGDNAHIGESMRNAMMLAKQELPATTKYEYQLIFEDDGLEAKKAAAAANKLISVDKVDALASISSGTGGVVSPIAEQNKVIHFGIASVPSVADGDYNFIHWTPPGEEARVMAAELQKRNMKKIAILTVNQSGFLEIRDRLKDALAKTDAQIVAQEVVNPDEKDFRSVIAKVKEKAPDIYVFLLFSPNLEIMTKQFREAGIATPLTGIESFGLSTQLQLFEGMWYVDAASANMDFNGRYEAHFHKPAVGFGGPNAYDIFNMLVYGFEHADAPSGVKPSEESVIRVLNGIKDFSGALGKLSVDAKGVVFSPASVKIIKDGKSVAAHE